MEENIVTPIIEPKKKPILEIVLAVLLIISLITAGDLFFRNQKLQKEITKLSAQPTPTPLTWNTYNNDELGYTISYPSKFKNGLKSNSNGYWHEQINDRIEFEPINGSGLTTSIVIEGNIDPTQNNIDLYSTSDENAQHITINGYPAIKRSSDSLPDNEGRPTKKTIDIQLIKGKEYWHIYGSTWGKYPINTKEIDQILSTFKFIDDLKSYSDNIAQFKYPSTLSLKEGRLILNNSSIEIFSSENLMTECMEFISDDKKFDINLKRFKKAIGGDFCGTDNSDKRETWITKEKGSYGPGLIIYYSLKDEEQLNNILNTILPTLKFTP